ncbi:MAG TPA: glycosyltransferase, partial [Devosia sp.]
CLITDAWVGIDLFLKPGEEVLVARDGRDVSTILKELSAEQASAIGERALHRVLGEHTYAHRAEQVDRIFRTFVRAAVEAAE